MDYDIKKARRIVVKIGSSLLVDDQTGSIRHAWLRALISDVVLLRLQGIDIVIVSSGSIALGRQDLQFKKKTLTLAEKQAAAAVGQIKLAHAYQKMLSAHSLQSAQILLTLDDSENRERYLNAKTTLETLLKCSAIPVINENDTVATAEIRFGDNDRLAARVAQMLSADVLILLSDIEGLYTKDPRLHVDATLIPTVKNLSPEILAMGGNSTTSYGSGGMITKLAAAQIAWTSGCKMVIASGIKKHPLRKLHTKTCTWFIPDISPTKARKNWIAQHLNPKGSLIIDEGAYLALKSGKSLLSVGVVTVEGNFNSGDAITIMTADKKLIGKGLSNYSRQEVNLIRGKKSSEFLQILGYQGAKEVIHRDNLIFL